jgi:three-Cys-motif partner protein
VGKLTDGDDGLPVEEVGIWSLEKTDLLCSYIKITSATRKKYLPPNGKGGACYIDLFCGPGRALIKQTNQFVTAGCVAAWQASVDSGSPFSKMLIGDMDEERLSAATERLKRLGAPVIPLLGEAKNTTFPAIQKAGGAGLHFAFLDPYNLGSLDFHVIETLARLNRIDILVHVSQMDLQRNFDRHSVAEGSPLDTFCPGWRSSVDTVSSQRTARQAYFEHWRTRVAETGVLTNAEMRLITGPGNQPLYLLLLAAKHELAHKFWQTVAMKDDGQGRLI